MENYAIRRISCFAFAIAAFLCAPVYSLSRDSLTQLSAEERSWLAAHPVIRVAPDPDFPPIERFNKNGELEGIAADYLRIAQQKLGVQFKIERYKTWDEVLDNARSRQVDMLSAAAQTPQRAQYLSFSSPHIVLPGVIITRIDTKGDLTIKSLKGKRVAIVSGYVWQEFLSRDHPEIMIEPVPDVYTGITRASFGSVDAFIENLATASHCIDENRITNLRVAGETGYYTRLSFAVRRDWPELVSVLEKTIHTIPSKEKEAIQARWIHLATGSSIPYRTFGIAMAGVFGGALLIIVIILGWSHSLRHQVADRTKELNNELSRRKQIEEALRESEQKFVEMVENANSIILRMDPQGKVTFFNRFAQSFFCYDLPEIIGQNVVGTIVPALDTSGIDLAGRMRSIGENPEKFATSENENMRKNGERVWVSWSNKPIFGRQGTLVEILCVGNDITQLKRIERTLKVERDFASAIFETAGALVAVLNAEGRIVRFNHTCERVTGYLFSEVSGKYLWDFLLLPEETERVKQVFASIKAGHFPNENENSWITKNGDRRLISWYNTAMLNSDGSVAHIISTGVDVTERRRAEEELITYRNQLEKLVANRTQQLSESVGRLENEIGERKRAESALKQSESRYRFLFESSPAGSLIIGRDGLIKDVNKAFLEGLGYGKEELIGKPAHDFVVEEERERVKQVLKERFQGKKVTTGIDTPVVAKNGAPHYIHFSDTQALLFENDTVSGILITGMDVTDRRKAEQLAKHHERQLMQADKMASLGILVSGVAHEINNPNNFILLNSENLLDVWKDLRPLLDAYSGERGNFRLAGLPYSELRLEIGKLIEGISAGTERIKKIVQSLKDFARQDAGNLDELVDMNSVIESAITICSNLIKKSTDNFRTAFGPDLPRLRGNSQQLEQVMINLIANSCQALTHKSKGISIETSHVMETRRIIVSVQDEGPGISPQHLAHIMDPFFTTKRDSGGTGLGLSISYSIIKDHKGEFTIESELGKGTQATLVLPVA